MPKFINRRWDLEPELKTLDYIPKTEWPDGPWHNEPDKAVLLLDRPISCVLIRNMYFGYWEAAIQAIGTTEDLRKRDLSKIQIHNGILDISYSPYTGSIVHFNAFGLNDKTPIRNANNHGEATYKTLDFMKKQSVELTRQLKEIKGY